MTNCLKLEGWLPHVRKSCKGLFTNLTGGHPNGENNVFSNRLVEITQAKSKTLAYFTTTHTSWLNTEINKRG